MTTSPTFSVLVFTRDLDRYSVMLLRELQQMGHTVNVVVEPASKPNARDWSGDVCIVDRVKLQGRFDKVAAKRYADLVVQCSADVCLCYTSRALSVALTAKRHARFKTPVVGTRGAIGGVSAFYLQDWFTYLSPRLDAVVCMSRAIADKLSKEARLLYPKHPGRFEVIYPGYGQLMQTHPWPQPRRRQSTDMPRLLCIANDRPIKGLAVLLDAMDKHVTTEHWHLDIVGECGAAIRAKVAQSDKLSRHVTVHGYRTDVPDFLQAAHIYIQPTMQPGEGIGNSMAEAMSYGLPVITSNVGGGIELTTHEKTGLHFDVGNAPSLALWIDRLIQDPVLCDAIGQAAAASLQQRFSLQQEAMAFLSLFSALMTPLRLA